MSLSISQWPCHSCHSQARKMFLVTVLSRPTALESRNRENVTGSRRAEFRLAKTEPTHSKPLRSRISIKKNPPESFSYNYNYCTRLIAAWRNETRRSSFNRIVRCFYRYNRLFVLTHFNFEHGNLTTNT